MQRYPAFAEILRQPDDDGPRLACAEWCDAHGAPARAEFIRVQVRLAAMPRLPRAERVVLRKRQRALLKSHAKRWLAELPKIPGVAWIKRFERGFVSGVHLGEAKTLVEHYPAIFASTPVRWMGIGNPGRQNLGLILDTTEKQGITSLTLNGSNANGINDAGAKILARSPALRHLRFLSLHSNAFKKEASIGPKGAAALADSPHLGNLRYLSLTQNPIGPKGVRALARSTRLPRLRSLELYGVEQDFDSTLDLLRSPLAQQLHALNIGGSSELTFELARFIADSENLAHLRRLDLNNTAIGDAGLMYLAQSTALPRLRRLYLRNSEFGDAGVITLARSPLASQLRVLDIEYSKITNTGAWELVESPHLRRLRRLQMYDDDGVTGPACFALKKRFGKRVQFDFEGLYPKVPPARHVWRPTNGFLDDIRHNPDDDTPRLVYADWLDDNGDPHRAAFIRVQCALARLAEDDPQRTALDRQESDLLKANQWQWTAGAFLHWLDHPPGRCPVQTHELCVVMADLIRLRRERESPDLSPAQKKSLGDKVRRREARFEALDFAQEDARLPLFETFTFQRGFLHAATVPEILFRFFACAVRDLGMIRELTFPDDDLERDIGDGTIDGLIAAMDWPRLERLEMNSVVEEMGSLRKLAAWPGLGRMKSLRGLFVFEEDEVGIVKELSSSAHLDCLEDLHLVLGDGPADPPVNALIQSARLPRIRRIHLQDAGDISPAMQQRFRARFPGVELLTGGSLDDD